MIGLLRLATRPVDLACADCGHLFTDHRFPIDPDTGNPPRTGDRRCGCGCPATKTRVWAPVWTRESAEAMRRVNEQTTYIGSRGAA